MKINGYRDMKCNVRREFNKTLSVIGLLVLSVLLLIVAFTPNAAATTSGCNTCHYTQVNEIAATYHGGVSECDFCHTGSYTSTPWYHPGTVVTESRCRVCHVQGTSLNESHGNLVGGSNYADCTQCHVPNATVIDPVTMLYKYSHNLTVEYNFYNYNLYGMPLESDHSTSKIGMFPYYTCTLSCHNGSTGGQPKIENEAIAWNQSKHAQSRVGSSDSKNSCAKCKSPINFNGNASDSSTIAQPDWQGIQCRICHNIHNDTYSGNNQSAAYPLAFYNATATNLTGSVVYDQVDNATVLCQECHTTASHDSQYAGYHKDTLGFTCADCHVNQTLNGNLTHTFEAENATSGVTGCEMCHNTADHYTAFQFTSVHFNNNVTCWACHDQTIGRNASGYAINISAVGDYGIFFDSTTYNWTTYKVSHSAASAWPLHNISRTVSCDKCHNATSLYNSTGGRQDTPLAPALVCSDCHSTYSNAVNGSNHNKTLNASAPDCTDCHTGYQPNYGHTSGTKGFIVNGTNTCTKSGCHAGKDVSMGALLNDTADCTQCHFANTTQSFSLNASLYTHDHNLTIEYNFYNYSHYGMPLSTNGGVGKGMFPYYTCTLTCHNNIEKPSLEDKAIAWNQSKHAQSRVGYDSKNSCAKCKSPLNFNGNDSDTTTIAQANWKGIQCRICHNIHNDTYSGNNQSEAYPLAFYNATATNLTGSVVYDRVDNATVLCEKCHTTTSHDSKYAGYHKDTLGFTCADCHVNQTLNGNLTHTFEAENATSGVTGCEMCHTSPATIHSSFFEYQYHGNVTCWACHDQTVSRNATNYSVSSDNNYGIYYDTTTYNWTTYKASHGSASTWPLHNISKNITCTKCHGARSAYTLGGIAPGFGGALTYTSQVTDPLVSGYNLIAIRLLPDPAISAKNLLYPSSGGIPGVTKVMKWDSTGQAWVSYIYDGSTYVGTNFTLDGYKGYFIMGNSSTAGQTYTFNGTG